MAQLSGTTGADTIEASSSSDQIFGLDGDDQIRLRPSFPGPHTVDAGPGNDTVYAGGVSATLTLGPGRDLAVATVNSSLVITDFQAGPGGDQIYIPVNDGFLRAFEGGGSWLQQSGADTLLISYGAFNAPTTYVTFLNTNVSSLTVDNFLTDLGGSQRFVPTDPRAGTAGGSDTFKPGTEGDDALTGTAGTDTIQGAGGRDYLRGMEGNDAVQGGAGDDDVNGNQGQDAVHGDDGADWARGGQGDDLVYGDAGDDPHVNGNLGDDRVFGGDGADTIYGGQGNDFVSGDAGNDLLSGDLGVDTLEGGRGADRFVLNPGFGTDNVTDFSYAEGDRIQLAAGSAYTVEATAFSTTSIVLASGDRLVLSFVQAASVNSEWIVYV